MTTDTPATPPANLSQDSSAWAQAEHDASAECVVPAAAGFCHPLRVRWAEADMQGVVFNGHYLTWFDIGMTEYLREAFAEDLALKTSFFHHLYVVRSTIDYRQSARFDELVHVSTRTLRLGRSSLTFAFRVSRDGDTLVEGESVYVHAIEGRSTPIPESIRIVLQTMEARFGGKLAQTL